MLDLISRRSLLCGMTASLTVAACARGQSEAQSVELAPGWVSGPDLPIRLQEIYPAVLDETIYVVGGLSPDEPPGPIGISDRVFALAPGATRWSERARLPIATHHPNVIAIGGRLYAVGGFNASQGSGWSMTRAVQIYDPQRNRWNRGPDMPLPFGETVMGLINGQLHVVTGRRPSGARNRDWSDHADTNAHILLDPATGHWSSAMPAPTARNSATSAVLDDRLHVIGGRTVSGGNTNAHEVYDPADNRWTRLAPLPQPSAGPLGAGGLAAAVLDGTIYVFGGEWFDSAGGGVYAQVWAYDSDADQWDEIGFMPTPRHGLGAVVSNGRIYTIAGASRAGGNQTRSSVEIFTPGSSS